jgi:hypothetical protein
MTRSRGTSPIILLVALALLAPPVMSAGVVLARAG